MQKLRRGDPAGLEALMDRYTPYLSAIAARVLPGRPQDWEELTADVFLAACLVLAGWSYGEQIIHLLSGGQVIRGGTGGAGYGTVIMSDGYDENGNPTIISLEDGRLWFVAGGQRVDVTDQVDEETSYVYTATDEEGNLHYIIVGGTPEDYGWFEGVTAPDGSGGGSGILHSRTDLPNEPMDPTWYTAGKAQVQELWKKQHQ